MDYVSFGGLDTRSGDLTVAPTDSRNMVNVDLHPVGQVRSRLGIEAVLNAPSSDRVEGLGYLKTTQTRYVYCATATQLYQADAGTPWVWDPLLPANVWTQASGVDFVNARYESNSHDLIAKISRGATLYIIGDGVPLRVHWGDGGEEVPMGLYSDTVPRAGIPAGAGNGTDVDGNAYEWRDWTLDPPKGLAMIGREKQEQMFAWGFTGDPNRVDVSVPGQPWNWLRSIMAIPTGTGGAGDGGWFYALTDDSDEVVGVSQVLDRTVVFKRTKTLVYTGLLGSETEPMRLQHSYPVGCTNFKSVVKAGSNLYWWSDNGPVTLYGVQEFGDLEYVNIGIKIDEEIRAITPSQEAGIHAYHDKKNFRIVWTVPSADGGTSSGTCLVYYYDSPQRWTRWTGEIAKMSVSIATKDIATEDTVFLGGHEDGNVYYLGKTNQDSGTDIFSEYVTPWLAMGDPDQRKRLIYLDVMVGDLGAELMEIQSGWDYTNFWRGTFGVAKALGETGGTWVDGFPDEVTAKSTDPVWVDGDPDTVTEDPVTWPVDMPANAGMWDETTQMIKKFQFEGHGHLVRFRFASSGTMPFQLVGWKAVLEGKGKR